MYVLRLLVFLLMLCDLLVALTQGIKDQDNPQRPGHTKKGRRPGDSLFRVKRKVEGHIYSQSNIIRNLLNDYHKQEPPMLDHPTEVSLGIFINSFYSISEQTMDYSINFYMRQSWTDRRLIYPNPTKKMEKIRLDTKTVSYLWLPDTFFRNEKRASYHKVTVDNMLLFLNLTKGNIWYVRKISATLSCPMNLQKYPLDTQVCPMRFESFGYTMDTMYFSWMPSPVDIDVDVQLPQFTLVEKILYDCSQNYTAGAYTCLEIWFVLQRDIGFFLIQVYIPSILIVILSWVAFWINIDAIPARVSLGLLTVLAMTTQSTGARATLPRVSYIKAIDVWMSTCLIFVFTSFLESAMVNVISRKEVQTIKPVRRPHNINIVENGSEHKGAPKVVDPQGKHKARNIEKASRKFFPLAFLLFNVVYWIMYITPGVIKEK